MRQHEVLEEALAIIERPGGWTQKAFCRSKSGGIPLTRDDVRFRNIPANSYCLLGAVSVAAPDHQIAESCEKLLDARARDIYGGDIDEVNDGVNSPLLYSDGGELNSSAAYRRTLAILRRAISDARLVAKIEDLSDQLEGPRGVIACPR